MVRVRFAPSPTGNLHIGGARTALFNWLFAKAGAGKFILRVEDTDALRSKKEYLDEIIFSLEWLGFKWDEIYYQSQRFDIYREYAERLVKEGKAYRSDKLVALESDETQENPIDKPQVSTGGQAIILNVIPQKIEIQDLIRGSIEFDSAFIKDQVLIKSDATPTYNFACVVDDNLMNITHVIRGDDHISNTPKQILIYKALGLPVPYFAHLPLILAKEGGRLSKRKGATAISEFREMGYLPQALVNFLVLLGWSPGDNRELIGIKEAIKLFDIKKVNKAAAILDMDKLNWINNQYLKNAEPEKLVDEVIPLLVEQGLIKKDNFDRNNLLSLVKLFQTRLTVLKDFPERADFFFLDKPKFESDAKEKYLAKNLSKEFKALISAYEKLDSFDSQAVEYVFRNVVSELGIKTSELVHPVRVALTGKTVGPGLFEIISALGKEKVLQRLRETFRPD